MRGPASAPKIATLARLASAGLPVPEFIALPDTSEPDEPTWARIDLLINKGCTVIVRAALPGEDTADAAAAGLGSSIAGCHDRRSIRSALRQISDNLRDPWLASYFASTGEPGAQVLVQREITGPWLAVVAQSRLRFVELHQRDAHDSEPLASGHSPTLAGPLALFPAELRAPICDLCDRVTAALPATPHGLDLELVADNFKNVWIVQARPLTRPLHPGWPAFVAAARRDLPAHEPDDALPLPGLWSLDAEHNPAPLSPAHAGVISRLAASHPALVRMRVLASWLYNPDRLERAPVTTTDHALREALQTLQTRHIPAARAVLESFDTTLAHASPTTLIDLVDRACEQLREVLERYASLPARPTRPPPAPGSLHSLQDRGAFLDVLPATWDIASPTLHDLSPRTATSSSSPDLSLETAPPDALATLLGELDDHLFALGLAPLRRVYLRAAQLLKIPGRDIFLLTPDELQAALTGESHDLEARRREHTADAALFPPLQMYDGQPVPSPGGGWLRGIAIGPPSEGPLHPRRDLAELLADPPPPGAVLGIPALTAQAAVVLRDLGVRAVCCEHGGAMSHAALMARELGLSALIGCRGCTSLAAGTHVRLDTRTGRLRVR